MKVSIIYNEKKQEALDLLEKLEPILKQKEILFLKGNVEPDSDYIISIGGDGTVLRCVRYAYEYAIPIASLNVGKLGFLGSQNIEMQGFIERLLLSEAVLENRTILKADYMNKTYTALNDIVIKNGDIARVIELDLYLDSKKIYHLRGDGIIIATATGSTAYSLAAGGPVLMPGLNIVLITPLNPHTIYNRPLLIKPRDIKIKPSFPGQKIIMTADGQVSKKLDSDESIEIKAVENGISFVKNEDSFFSLLCEKFGWG